MRVAYSQTIGNLQAKPLYREAAYMSNEELVAVIQAGASERMGELWEQVEGLVKWKAKRIMTVLQGVSGRGVEFDDLYQSGYLAMVAAVETYKAESGSFSNWLSFYLKTTFAEVTGYRTVKDKMEPLNNATSLDKMVGGEEDGTPLGDIVPDPYAAATMDAVEEKLWREQLHEALESVLGEIPTEESNVLRRRYYERQTLAGAAQDLGTTSEEIRKLEGNGIKALRHHRLAKRIRPFYDFDYYSGTGLGAFRNTGMSVQERYMIHLER